MQPACVTAHRLQAAAHRLHRGNTTDKDMVLKAWEDVVQQYVHRCDRSEYLGLPRRDQLWLLQRLESMCKTCNMQHTSAEQAAASLRQQHAWPFAPEDSVMDALQSHMASRTPGPCCQPCSLYAALHTSAPTISLTALRQMRNDLPSLVRTLLDEFFDKQPAGALPLLIPQACLLPIGRPSRAARQGTQLQASSIRLGLA